MELNYATIIEAMADRLGDEPCIVFGDKVVSYRDFEDSAARIAQALSNCGLGKDSKVGLFLYNCNEYMEATLAAYKIRAIPININYRYTGDELLYLLEDCEAEALIFHSSLADQVSAIQDKASNLKLLVQVDNDGRELIRDARPYQDILREEEKAPRIERSSTDTLMLYTGGTTGMPKGVEFNIGDMLANILQVMPQFLGFKVAESLEELVEQAADRAQNGERLVSLPASPLMHTAAILNSGIQVQLYGGVMVILTSASFDPVELWDAVEKNRVDHMLIVGDTFAKPMLKALDEEASRGVQRDLSCMKMLVSSGVMFSKESKLKFLELSDMTIMDGAGATEGGMAMQLSSRQNPPAETGEFIALPTTVIFNENYEAIPRGSDEVGMIGMGGGLPRGYYKDEAKTAKTFREIDGVRYGFTGDMGSIDENGILKFMGRGSNCINTGGEKVFPEEVEEVIKQHPQVKDCLVVGLPHEQFGQSVAAVVSLYSDIASPKDELMEFASSKLARYKLPRTVEIVEQVQRAPNGKADYKWAKSVFE